MTHSLAQILWQAPRLLPLAAIVAAATLLLVLVFYLPQARRLRQPWRWGLPLLRLAVGLALAASLLQPAIVRSDSAGDPGAVVVLVDASRSMSVVDPRTPAQRVALADALGALSAGVRTRVAPDLSEELTELSRRVDEASAARADVDYAKLSGQGIIAAQSRYDELAAAVAALATRLAQRGQAMPQPGDLETKLAALAPAADGATRAPADYRPRIAAARTALRAAQAAADAAAYERPDVKPVCDALAGMTRAQLAERAIRRSSDGVLTSLAASGVYGFTFADALQPLPGTTAATQPAIDPRGLRSDLAAALRGVAERMKGRPVQAIVVLTDGRQVGGETGVRSSLADAGLPVFTVSVGSASPRDLAIADVSVAQRQFVDETTTLRVQLRGIGVKGQAATVKLDAGGQSQSKATTFTGPTASVEFPLKFDAAGTHPVSVAVAPLEGEITAENNAVHRRVIATPDRAAVALVGAHASWDFQHLRAALSRAAWATLEAEVLDAPGARWSLPPEQVAERAVVVLADVAVDHLTSRQWDALYRFVADRGGSVLFVAGQNTAAPQFVDSPLLTGLLPFRAGVHPAWRTWPGEQPLFRFQPAAIAGDLPALKLSDDAGGTGAAGWLDLPAVFQFLPVTELKANTTPLLIERASGLAVLTESRLGLGRVLFFGVNETWRWRRGTDSSKATAAKATAAHERFWLQLLRHAVDQPYAVRDGSLRLDADRVVVQPGQSVHVRARIDDLGSLPPTEATQPLALLRDGEQVAEVSLTLDDAGGGRYAGAVDNLAAGGYELQLRDPNDPSVVAKLPIHVEPDVESEMRDVSADERTLRRLAESTGGQFLTLSEWNTLPARLREARQTDRQVAEHRLWDSPQLFAFVLGCLGIEWAMRKRLGLA